MSNAFYYGDVLVYRTYNLPKTISSNVYQSLGTEAKRSLFHRSRIRYLDKKNSRILTNFPKLKKFVKIPTKIR